MHACLYLCLYACMHVQYACISSTYGESESLFVATIAEYSKSGTLMIILSKFDMEMSNIKEKIETDSHNSLAVVSQLFH